MTHDYTYLNQLPLTDLLAIARQADLGDHLVRALLDRLEEYSDAYEQVNRLEAELADAEARADSWRDKAQIAAAPELLEAVRASLKQHGKTCRCNPCQLARAAIAKAEARS